MQEENKVIHTEDIKNKTLYIMGALLSLLIILATIGVWTFSLSQKTKEVKVIEPQEQENKEAPSQERDKALFVFEVLNGSGVAGAAGKSARVLEEKGYKVAKVGNAPKVSENTQLFLSENLLDKSDLLISDLSDEFTISSVSGTIDEDEVTARMIVGKK